MTSLNCVMTPSRSASVRWLSSGTLGRGRGRGRWLSSGTLGRGRVRARARVRVRIPADAGLGLGLGLGLELSSGTARKMRLVSSFSIRDCSGPRACVKTWLGLGLGLGLG